MAIFVISISGIRALSEKVLSANIEITALVGEVSPLVIETSVIVPAKGATTERSAMRASIVATRAWAWAISALA